MAITRVQNQTNFTQKPVAEPHGNVTMERLVQLPKMHYRNCTDIPDSVNNIRPERGQGHLIGNNPIKAFGRFFSNRYYDLKSVYKGYTGTANDHQLGRTNDVGLVAGGLSIAAFLATKRGAILPKHMEFIGLGSFLASMSLWPKIGVFGPARLVHGFDVDKRYIDDQGRNKSVFQDPNYVPFDLFDGRRKSENLNDIANYMGISKTAVNRDDMAKDQMVKVARQNNTLWMITSGGAVPIMTALLSNAAERVYTPYLFAQKAKNHETELFNLHKAIRENTFTVETKKSGAGKSVSQILSGLADNKIVTQAQIDKALNAATEGLNSEFGAGLSREINGRLAGVVGNQVVADEKFISKLAENLETTFQGSPNLKQAILSVDGIKATLVDNILANGVELKKSEVISQLKTAGISNLPSSVDDFLKQTFEQAEKEGKSVVVNADFVNELMRKFDTTTEGVDVAKIKFSLADKAYKQGFVVNKEELLNKIQNASVAKLGPENKEVLARRFAKILNADKTLLPASEKMIITEEVKNILKAVAEPIERYSAKCKKINAVNELQMGADSVNAHYWGKLQQAFIDIAISDKCVGKLKKLMDNTPDITDNVVANLEKIAKDDKAFTKAVSAINEIKMAYLKDILGTGYEEQYVDVILGNTPDGSANWARRVAGENGNKIDKFIEMHRIVADELANELKDNVKLGEARNTFVGIIRENIPNNEAIGQISKVENFVSACDRIVHSLDVYKRAELYKNSGDARVMAEQLGRSGGDITPGWINELFEKAKRETIAATSNDVFTRYGLKDKPQKFQSLMNLMFPCVDNYEHLNNATINALAPKEMIKINERLAVIEACMEKNGADIEKLAAEKAALLEERAKFDKPFNNSLATIKSWMSRFKNIVPEIYHNHGNGMGSNVDLNWQYAGFNVVSQNQYPYDKLKTPEAKYRIQAKNLVELADQGIKQAHNSGKWFKTFGGLFVGIWAASVATQFFFGKKDSTIPLEKDRLRQERLAARAERMEASRAN